MSKTDEIERLEASELARAEGWKARATEIAAARAALEGEMAENAPRTAVGAQALAEVKRALMGQTGTAAERIAARVAARQAAPVAQG